MAKPVVIDIKNVWKIYQMDEVEVAALRGLNIKIHKNEFVAIMGPSGSGKSTAMNMVGALDIPSRGKVLLEGKDISKMLESKLAQIRGRKIGFVFQVFNLLKTLNAIENVKLPMIFAGKDNRDKRAQKILAQVGLKERINHYPGEMSGGERQRVAIARALANDPEIILADEPTGNLDSKSGEEILNLLDELHKKYKKTIVLVTHDRKIAKHAERIIHIIDGRVE